MKDWIPLFQTLIWPGVVLIVTLIVIKIFPSQVRELLGAITNRVRALRSVHIRKGEIALTFDIKP